MPSSTSSSKLVLSFSTKSWAIAFVLVAVLLAFHEAGVRSLGMIPNVGDDKDLWSYKREAIYGENKVVFVGASRIYTAIDPEAARSVVPGLECIQLGLGAMGGFPTFEDLAHDEDFNGVLVYSIHPAETWFDSGQKDFVKYYHENWNVFRKLDLQMRLWVEERFAIRANSFTNPVHVMRIKELPKPSYRHTTVDRNGWLDFSMLSEEEINKLRKKTFSEANEYKSYEVFEEAVFERYKPLVDKIHARGGQVVFLEMPLSGPFREAIELHYPHDQFLRALSEYAGAITLHHTDLGPHDYLIPDYSHIDKQDKPVFTKRLITALVNKGVIER